MRYLVFGDVHGNVDALDVVLAWGRQRGVDAYLFVGDVVGYGAAPLECLERLRPLHQSGSLAWVAGNHERVVRGETETDGYGMEALETLAWTRQLLAAHPWARDFIAAAPLIAKISGGIWLTHDSLHEPGSGTYHRGTANAHAELGDLANRGGRICFYGHTHTMRAELLLGNEAVMLAPMTAQTGPTPDAAPLKIGHTERAWVGTGSAGFPTRQKGLAECLVLDDAHWTLEKYAVPYPREQARERTRQVLTGTCSPAVVDRLVRWL